MNRNIQSWIMTSYGKTMTKNWVGSLWWCHQSECTGLSYDIRQQNWPRTELVAYCDAINHNVWGFLNNLVGQHTHLAGFDRLWPKLYFTFSSVIYRSSMLIQQGKILMYLMSICECVFCVPARSIWRSRQWCREPRGCWSRTGPQCPALQVRRVGQGGRGSNVHRVSLLPAGGTLQTQWCEMTADK